MLSISSLQSIPEHGVPQNPKNASLPNFNHAKFMSIDYIDRHDSQGQGQGQPTTQWIDKPGGTIIVIERQSNKCANNQWLNNQSVQNIPVPSTSITMPPQSAIQTDKPGNTAIPVQAISVDHESQGPVPPVDFNFQNIPAQSVSGSSLESDGVVSMINLAHREQQDDYIQDVIQHEVKRSSTYTLHQPNTFKPEGNTAQQVNNWILIEKL